MVTFNGINHLALATADMNATIRFWRDLLGLRLVAGLGRPGYRHYFFELSDHDLIAFFEWPEVQPISEKDHGVPVKGPFAFDHLSLGVTAKNDLWTLKDKLEAADFWVSEVIDHGFILSVYTFDPNNIPLEFSFNVPEIDIRRHPKMMDTHACESAREGAAPQPGKWPPVKHPTPEKQRFVFPGEGRIFVEKK